MGHISKIRDARNSRRKHFLSSVPEKNWTQHYTPALSDHPRAALRALRVRVHPSTAAHYANDGGLINWPYNPASYQVFVMNGWYGNQLPGNHKRPWEDPEVNKVNAIAHTQNHNPMGVAKRGEFGPQMSQKTAQGILAQVSSMWANVRSGTYGN